MPRRTQSTAGTKQNPAMEDGLVCPYGASATCPLSSDDEMRLGAICGLDTNDSCAPHVDLTVTRLSSIGT
jgi:hypothetical protein